MEKFNGLGVILENRYYGESYPYNTSTTDELRFLTTEQSQSASSRITNKPSNKTQLLQTTPTSDSTPPSPVSMLR